MKLVHGIKLHDALPELQRFLYDPTRLTEYYIWNFEIKTFEAFEEIMGREYEKTFQDFWTLLSISQTLNNGHVYLPETFLHIDEVRKMSQWIAEQNFEGTVYTYHPSVYAELVFNKGYQVYIWRDGELVLDDE